MATRQSDYASMALLARNEAGGETTVDLNTEKIKEWRSIVTLIVFVFASKCPTCLLCVCVFYFFFYSFFMLQFLNALTPQ